MKISIRKSARLRAASDLITGFLLTKIWVRSAVMEVRRRYLRTLFGPLWTTFTVGAFTAMLALVWGEMWAVELSTYLPYLSSGLILWYFISQILSESCSYFLNGGGLIQEVNTNLSSLVYAGILRSFIVLLHNSLVVVGVYLYFGLSVDITILMLVPMLLLVVIFLTGISFALAVITVRFRDMAQLVNTAMPIIFICTPIFWYPEAMGGARTFLIEYNPFYHMLDIVRDPVLMQMPSGDSVIIVSVLAIVAWVVGVVAFVGFRDRVVYWL